MLGPFGGLLCGGVGRLIIVVWRGGDISTMMREFGVEDGSGSLSWEGCGFTGQT